MATLPELWPPAAVVARTPRLELRFPTMDDLVALAALAEDGIHDEDAMPFLTPWTRASPRERAWSVLQWNLRQWAEWTAEKWCWAAVTVVDGEVVGTQGMSAASYTVTRAAGTGSYLGRKHQGQGIGKEMRAAILHLLFAGLDAERVATGAFDDNLASLGVTRALGYRPNGEVVHAVESKRRRELRFVMDRADWEKVRRDDIVLDGVDAARPLFGLDTPEVEGAEASG